MTFFRKFYWILRARNPLRGPQSSDTLHCKYGGCKSDSGCDLRQYANTLALLNPEDIEFFAQPFLDSYSDDDGEFWGFEDLNFIPIEWLANASDDANFPEDVANNGSRNSIDDVVMLTMPYDYSMVGMNVLVPADASPFEFLRNKILEIIVIGRQTCLLN